jgi:hypothetical protein
VWRLTAIASACLVPLLLFGGCGADASKRDVADVVQRFQAALAAGDGDAACAQLTASARDSLESEEELPCPRAVLELHLRGGGTVTERQVDITSASADVSGRGTAFLDQTPRGWRISAAGCSPASPGMPYDCELES